EHIPMVILDRPQDMLRDFVHVEKAHRNAPAGHPAKFADRCLNTFSRKMLEQIVSKTKLKALWFRVDFKHIPLVETRARKQGAGILDVLLAEIEAGILECVGQAIGSKKTVIIGRTAGRLEEREFGRGPTAARFLRRTTQCLTP